MAFIINREDDDVIIGRYFTNGWCIELQEQSIFITRDGHFVDDQFPIFIHEYWHYLQNISTVSGAMSFLLYQYLLSAFTHTLQLLGDGRSTGILHLSPSIIERSIERIHYINILNGRTSPTNYDTDYDTSTPVIIGIRSAERHFTLDGNPGQRPQIIITFRCINGSGGTHDYDLPIGVIAIEEGIAYEIEQLIAGTDDAPFFPYHVLRTLANYLCPGISTYELLAIATHSLMRLDPASSLIFYFSCYGRLKTAGIPEVESLRMFAANYQNTIREAVHLILQHDLPDVININSGRGLADRGIRAIVGQYQQLLSRRIDEPFFDLFPFSRRSPILLNNFLRQVLPCDLLQKYPGDAESTTKDILRSFNIAPEPSGDIISSRALRTLQCQLHYLMVHLGGRLFYDFQEVEQRKSEDERKCPFFNSCSLDIRIQQSEICRRRPWATYQMRPNIVCWYGAAVSSCLGPSKISEIRG